MRKTERALILDLDDTIFRTRSMDPEIFAPFFENLISKLDLHYDSGTIRHIVDDLWKHTWDKVLDKYSIPSGLFSEAIQLLDKTELDLKIIPYPDYNYLKQMPCQKFLVTTSLTSLQESKIKALGIENDFEKIIINDTFRKPGTKLEIFKELQNTFALNSKTTYVIGDNPDSEIAAGNALNMVTIQILREGVQKGLNANHYIHSFQELESLFRDH